MVESDLGGKVKVGRKTGKVNHRSAYVLVPVGTHKVYWKPEGTSKWQRQGKVTIEDIGKGTYQVRLANGKVTEVKQL